MLATHVYDTVYCTREYIGTVVVVVRVYRCQPVVASHRKEPWHPIS
jgi:hypothetical protein